MTINVLIVDDEVSIVDLLLRILARDPIFAADAAARGFQAVDMAAHKAYDALICDIALPDIDGPEVVKEMKQRRCCPPLVVYISGAVKMAPHNMSGDMVFIRKPFNPGEIMSVLLRYARRSQA